MKYETIDAGQLKDIMNGRDPRPPEGWDDGDSSGGGPSLDKGASGPSSADEASDDGGDEDDETPRRRPSDPLGGPAGS